MESLVDRRYYCSLGLPSALRRPCRLRLQDGCRTPREERITARTAYPDSFRGERNNEQPAHLRYPMSRHGRLVRTILRRRSDANIRLDALRALMRYLGFEERVRGSHHIFDKEGIVELVNLQGRGGQAKPYQVRQVRRLILKYKLGADG